MGLSIYDSERLAKGYAHCRPPVHSRIVRVIENHLRTRRKFTEKDIPARRALDIGCGAGLSTAALAPLAGRRIGLEPIRVMLEHCTEVGAGASFVAGRAEQLPFAGHSFDLITAAGSLNYVDCLAFLPEAGRALTHRGLMIVYDFSAGRRLPGESRLDEWFTTFEQRYPFPPGYAMDVTQLPYDRGSLHLESYEAFEVSVPMTSAAYLEYVLTETNVELALSRGTSEHEIEAWCRSTLDPFFPKPSAEVLFDAYVAVVERN
jgi:ubiquinone/menaquinone biosynthesis C-methylase UbiE